MNYRDSKIAALRSVISNQKTEVTSKGEDFAVLSTKDDDYLVVTNSERSELDMHWFYKVWTFIGASNEYAIYRLRLPYPYEL